MNGRCWGVWVWVSLLGMASGTLFGAAGGAANPTVSAPPAPASTNVQDFSQGFRTFLRMGLPDTSKARYVRLEYYSNRGMQPEQALGGEVQLAGNAWLLTENKDAKSVLVSMAGQTLALYDQKMQSKRQEAALRSNAVVQASGTATNGASRAELRRGMGGNPWEESGTWREVDLSRDLARALALVDKKIKAKDDGAREMQYDAFVRSDAPAGMLFVFATLAWQQGKVEEANALAGRLFTLLGDSRKVIVGALNIVADAQLAAATAEFQRAKDWQAYREDLANLVKRYPAGWRQAGAVKILVERLQQRMAMPTPPVVNGEGLDAEDQKLATALVTEAAASQAGQMWRGQLWLLPAPMAGRGMFQPASKDDSALGRLVARGSKALPLLIAMATDETLCPVTRSMIAGHTYYSYDSDANRNDAEHAKVLYDRMERPLTRGELACALLAPLCRREEQHGEVEAAAAETVVASAKQLYAAVKGLPPAALSRYFLEKGDDNQKQQVINYLVQGDCETNAPAIEAFLLTLPSDEFGGLMRNYYVAQQYVQKRGAKAADFVEKFAALSKQAGLPRGMEGDAKYAKRMEKDRERLIKALRALTKSQDLAQAVGDLAASTNMNDNEAMIYATLAQQKPAVALPVILAAAVKATNVTARSRLLSHLQGLRYAGMQEEMQAGVPEGSEEDMAAYMAKLAAKNQLSIGTNAAAWQLLLADLRPMQAQRWYGGDEATWTIADLAAYSIEALYAEPSQMEQSARRGGTLRPDKMFALQRARAAARLAGKTEAQLPKYPSADDVPAERRQAIEAALRQAKPAALGKMVEPLTDAEQLYVAELVNENKAIAQLFAPLARMISLVKMPTNQPVAVGARLRKLEGTPVTTNALTEMREFCRQQLVASNAVTVALSAAGFGRGLQLTVTGTDQAMVRMYDDSRSIWRQMGVGRKGMITGFLQAGNNHGNAMWLVDLPAPAKTSAVPAAVDDRIDQMAAFANSWESQQEQFESAAELFCKAEELAGDYVRVQFMGMLPPVQGQKQQAGQDDDGEDEGDEDQGSYVESIQE